MPTVQARSTRWIHRYLPLINLGGFALVAAEALAEPGDLLVGNAGYAALRWLPEGAWLAWLLLVGTGQVLPGLIALHHPPPAWMGRAWRITWTVGATVVWAALGVGLWQTGPNLASRLFVWLAWVELTRIGASEISQE